MQIMNKTKDNRTLMRWCFLSFALEWLYPLASRSFLSFSNETYFFGLLFPPSFFLIYSLSKKQRDLENFGRRRDIPSMYKIYNKGRVSSYYSISITAIDDGILLEQIKTYVVGKIDGITTGLGTPRKLTLYSS